MGRFIKFVIGAFLVLGSIIFGLGLAFGGFISLVANPGVLWMLILWALIDFVAFLAGIFLMRS